MTYTYKIRSMYANYFIKVLKSTPVSIVTNMLYQIDKLEQWSIYVNNSSMCHACNRVKSTTYAYSSAMNRIVICY